MSYLYNCAFRFQKNFYTLKLLKQCGLIWKKVLYYLYHLSPKLLSERSKTARAPQNIVLPASLVFDCLGSKINIFGYRTKNVDYNVRWELHWHFTTPERIFFLQSLQKNRYLQTLNKLHKDNIMIACLASVSVWFRSNERPRNGIFCFRRARNGTRAKKWKRGEGRKETLADKPQDFENPACQRTGRLTGSASRTLLTCVDQKFVSYREVVTRIWIFCGYCLFWSARFAL